MGALVSGIACGSVKAWRSMRCSGFGMTSCNKYGIVRCQPACTVSNHMPHTYSLDAEKDHWMSIFAVEVHELISQALGVLCVTASHV